MRIPSSSATARVAPDFHAARGDKNGSRTPDDNDNHGQSPGTSSAGNGTSTPDSSSQEAALRQAFNAALGAAAVQMASNAMARFHEAISEEDS
ncbi:hypothetical protein GCM10010987_46080 [Bradyrhizobium guangdongense]|uniref:Nodulation protein NopC n=1 Tax=Bradyrhizobium guangdongense TaxID=1325090 RepID=A0AA88B9U9_9BRAD|nr:hypothetical protein GCM10010987_46080 [Bradyrhizobium guangdongense]